MTHRLTKEQIARFSESVAAAIGARGPMPLGEAMAWLKQSDLTGSQAALVVAHGLAHALFALDPLRVTLSAERRGGARRFRGALSAVKSFTSTALAALRGASQGGAE